MIDLGSIALGTVECELSLRLAEYMIALFARLGWGLLDH
jgi:hypothetical protein